MEFFTLFLYTPGNPKTEEEEGKGDFRLKLKMVSHAWWEVELSNHLLKVLRCLFQQDYFA